MSQMINCWTCSAQPNMSELFLNVTPAHKRPSSATKGLS